MRNIAVDVAVLGAGTAGLAAYRAAKAAGATALLVESGPGGTTCARVGCMPSKLLIAAADSAESVRAAGRFGIRVEAPIHVDGCAVMTRVRTERDRFVGLVLDDVAALPVADRLAGRATFVDDTTIDVGDHTRIRCKSSVIATGSRAEVPTQFHDLGDRLITSDAVFAWSDLPRAVAIIGPGIVGLELGQALHRLGVRVVVLGNGGQLGPLRDPSVLAAATAILQRELTLELNAPITAAVRHGNRVELHRTDSQNRDTSEYFDLVLATTGRVPEVTGLGLENTSLRLDAHGVPSFHPTTTQAEFQAGVGPVFLAGDVAHSLPLLHEAADAGKLAGTNAARWAQGLEIVAQPRRAGLNIVFTDPQMAIVGGGFAAMPPGAFATGSVDFADQGRSRVIGKNQGLLRVYGSLADGQFLGAEMIAPAAEHLAHLLAWALQNAMTVEQMLAMPFYHPTIEEGVRHALRDLQHQLQLAVPDYKVAHESRG